ncbi:MAG: PIN domain-containing protein, partial [Thermoplasmata archaeon]
MIVASLRSDGVTRSVLRGHHDLERYAPAMVRPEIERHPPRVVERSGWPTEVVGVVLYEVLGRLPVVPTERFSTALPSAWRRVQAALAPLGEAYVALADVLSAPIRTYDQDFRRIEGVTVLSAFGFGDRVLPVLSEDPAVHG